jgi:Protein of unknown function (DUF3738)
MAGRFGAEDGSATTPQLSALSLTFALGCAAFALLNAVPVRVQSQATPIAPVPSFEVAAIRLNRSENGNLSIGFHPGMFTTVGAPAESLIEYAYSLKSDAQLSGAPSWINSDRYDIDAKVDESLTDKLQKLPVQEWAEQVKFMVRSLLADRFKLQVSHATKQLPVTNATPNQEQSQVQSISGAIPAYDIASIKLNRSDNETSMMRTLPDGFSATRATLGMIIQDAYGVEDNQISGSPKWLRSERYDI